MGNDLAKNPFMMLALRLIQHHTSAAQTAFRHSLLSLGAAHLFHQHQHTSLEQGWRMRLRTVKSRRKAMAYLSIGLSKERDVSVDLMLATCLTLIIRNVSAGLILHQLD
jgi:hypothetical protein